MHRDLKPGNVMLTKSRREAARLRPGARRWRPRRRAGSLTALPTQQGLTQEGTILGTFQYMAPEQLEGKDADARTDIFAFGSVLYEMATGKKAFAAKSQASSDHGDHVERAGADLDGSADVARRRSTGS